MESPQQEMRTSDGYSICSIILLREGSWRRSSRMAHSHPIRAENEKYGKISCKLTSSSVSSLFRNNSSIILVFLLVYGSSDVREIYETMRHSLSMLLRWDFSKIESIESSHKEIYRRSSIPITIGEDNHPVLRTPLQRGIYTKMRNDTVSLQTEPISRSMGMSSLLGDM